MNDRFRVYSIGGGVYGLFQSYKQLQVCYYYSNNNKYFLIYGFFRSNWSYELFVILRTISSKTLPCITQYLSIYSNMYNIVPFTLYSTLFRLIFQIYLYYLMTVLLTLFIGIKLKRCVISMIINRISLLFNFT